MEFVPRVLSAACPEARAEVASAAKRAAGDTNLLRLAQVKKEPLRELCFSQGKASKPLQLKGLKSPFSVRVRCSFIDIPIPW